MVNEADFNRAMRNRFFDLSGRKRKIVAREYEARNGGRKLSQTGDYGRALAIPENLGFL